MSTPSSIICNFIFISLPSAGYKTVFKKEIIFNFSKRVQIRSFYGDVNIKSKKDVSLLIKKLETESFSWDLNKNNYSNINLQNFRLLANGIFQAEGHIGGYFISHQKRIIFRPLVFIGITASYESILFLVFLNKQLGFKMRYTIESLPSGLIFVKLLSTDWSFIINFFMPYFNKIYGDKYKGLKRLEKIHSLQNFSLSNSDFYTDSTEINEKVNLLAYNLIDNSKRKISIADRFSLFNITPTLTNDFLSIEENKEPISNYFLLGFILGELSGNIYVRIRETQGLPSFIPSIRISQQITKENLFLLNSIKNTLDKEKIVSKISIVNHLLVLAITEINNIENLSKWLPDSSILWFWKKREYLLLKKSLLLLKLKATTWREGKEILLCLIYKISKYKQPIEYWQNILVSYYSSRVNSSLYYISISKEIAWQVKLPIKVKPKTKYFFFKTYGSKELAFFEAQKYRDTKLKNWIKELELENE